MMVRVATATMDEGKLEGTTLAILSGTDPMRPLKRLMLLVLLSLE